MRLSTIPTLLGASGLLFSATTHAFIAPSLHTTTTRVAPHDVKLGTWPARRSTPLEELVTPTVYAPVAAPRAATSTSLPPTPTPITPARPPWPYTRWGDMLESGPTASVPSAPKIDYENMESETITDSQLFTFGTIAEFATASYCLNLTGVFGISESDIYPHGTWDNLTQSFGQLHCAPGSNSCPEIAGHQITLAYEWAYDDGEKGVDTGGYIATVHNSHAVVFVVRGQQHNNLTSEMHDWINTPFQWTGNNTSPPCHGCRWDQRIQDHYAKLSVGPLTAMRKILEDPVARGFTPIVVGHQLGGVWAHLFAKDLAIAGATPFFYTFGSPRVFNRDMAEWFETAVPNNYRITRFHDIVPNWPTLEFGYQHVRPEYFINAPREEAAQMDGEKLHPRQIKKIWERESLKGSFGFDGNKTDQESPFYFHPMNECLTGGKPRQWNDRSQWNELWE